MAASLLNFGYVIELGSFDRHALTVGVGNDYLNSKTDRIYVRYYQWVGIILVTLAFLFYLPALTWKLWEDGRMESICSDFGSPLISPNWNGIEAIRIVKYLRQKNHKIIHRMYAYRFLFCEILNFGVVLASIFGLDVIFSDFWTEYSKAVGAVLAMNSTVWLQQSSRIFPKMAKCNYNLYGPSGSVETRDTLCLLPLNIVNEKIFAFIWLWIIFIFTISAMNLIYKFILIINCHIRLKILQSQTYDRKFSDIRLITYNADFGQWFFLYQMSQNINPAIFNEIINELIKYDREFRYEEKDSGDEQTI
ncbi:hypothetical protein DMENIID0001_082310 [Sergentomyia squamirostris]